MQADPPACRLSHIDRRLLSATARRGSRGALIAIVVTRVISAVLAVPAFFLNAPAWVMIVEGFVIAATITALVLVHQQSQISQVWADRFQVGKGRASPGNMG